MIDKLNSFLYNLENTLIDRKTIVIISFLSFVFIGTVIVNITSRRLEKNSMKLYMDKYKDPYEYEKYVASELSKMGYTNVIVTSKCKDYGADLICNYGFEKYAIQVKMYTGSVGYRAIEEVMAGMHYYNCDHAMIVTTGHFSKQAIEAAEVMGVVLIDNFL